MAAATKAKPAMAPITMPAMAPPERLDFFSLDPEDGAGLAVADPPVVDADAELAVAEAADEAAEDALEVALEVAELTILEEIVPPKTSANFTTPTLVVQQSLLPPQHHRSLSACPVHGVKAVFPNPFLV